MFRKLVTIDEAQKIIRQHFKPHPLGTEEIHLLNAAGRTLAEDVTATLDIPPFDRSTVDGYAVNAEDTFGAEENRPITLKLTGTVNIGEMPKTKVTKGKTAEIVTGAPIPQGADAVVMLEHTERANSNVSIFSPVVKDENIMKTASDIRKGQKILTKGTPLSSRQIGMLAAIGKATIKVYRTPRVAVLSTGPEITEPGKKLAPAKIYDINAYSLSVAVTESGADPIYLGVIQDDLSQLQKALRNALASADMVVTSGGVSVGPKDIMPRAVNSLGKPGLIVCGISIKPGKPTTVASIYRKPVFSLPGHPASALLVFDLLTRPLIQQMARKEVAKPTEVKAIAETRMFPAKGSRTYVMVKLARDKKVRLTATPLASSLSGAITTLAKADGYVQIPENVQFIEAGERCTVHVFSGQNLGN